VWNAQRSVGARRVVRHRVAARQLHCFFYDHELSPLCAWRTKPSSYHASPFMTISANRRTMPTLETKKEACFLDNESKFIRDRNGKGIPIFWLHFLVKLSEDAVAFSFVQGTPTATAIFSKHSLWKCHDLSSLSLFVRLLRDVSKQCHSTNFSEVVQCLASSRI